MENQASTSNMLKPVNPANKKPLMVGVGIVVVIAGLGVGWFLSGNKAIASNTTNNNSGTSVSQNEAGVKDISTIKNIKVDDATGTLQTGGAKGVGSYHLDRPGGADKVIYLTSTTVDMSPFVGKKVHIWGQTQDNKNVSWFMDVLKIQVSQ